MPEPVVDEKKVEEEKKEEKKESPPPSPTNPFSGLSPEEKDRLLLQQATTIRETTRKNVENENRVRALEEKVNAPPPPTPAEIAAKDKGFFAAPVTTTRAIVHDELKEQIKPLIEFKDQFQNQATYERIKGQFKNDPKFKDMLADPQLENTVDQLMSNQEASERNLYGVLIGLRGAIEIGEIPRPSTLKPSEGGERKTVDTTIPPHLRPSPPPAPESEAGKTKVRDLTENERRLAREAGMTPEDFVAWQDIDAMKVPVSKLGIPEKKEKEEAKK